MFKNRAFQVKLVKTDDAANEVAALPNISITKEDVKDVTDNLIKKTAVAVISVVAAVAVAKTASEIAIYHATN